MSQALGHSATVVPARYYRRFIRKDYSRGMLGPLKLTNAKILAFKPTE
ncbi:MAG: hypothetical protein ABI321_11170 [Polyangia bacterium]